MGKINGRIKSEEKYRSSCKYSNKSVEITVCKIEFDSSSLHVVEKYVCNSACGNGDCICNVGTSKCFGLLKKVWNYIIRRLWNWKSHIQKLYL